MKDEPIQKFLTPSIKNESQESFYRESFYRESSNRDIEATPFGLEGWFLVDVDKISDDFSVESDGLYVSELENIIHRDRESEESVHLTSEESLYLKSEKSVHLESEESVYLETDESVHFEIDESEYLKSEKSIHLESENFDFPPGTRFIGFVQMKR